MGKRFRAFESALSGLVSHSYEMKMAHKTERVQVSNDGVKYEDASQWNIDEVVTFFTDNGHRQQAQVFRDQVHFCSCCGRELACC